MFQTFVDVSPRKCVVPNLLQQIVGNPCALPDWSKMKVFQPPTRGHWERLQTFFHTVMSIYLGSLILDSLGYVFASATNNTCLYKQPRCWMFFKMAWYWIQQKNAEIHFFHQSPWPNTSNKPSLNCIWFQLWTGYQVITLDLSPTQ